MLTSETLQFLYELSQNNNRDWFEKNKKRYESVAKKPFEQFVGHLIRRIQAFEPQFRTTPKESIFRLYRDTRFSTDKTPYKTHLSAVFTTEGRKTINDPGYYLQVGFGSLSLGGGAYFLEKDTLTQMRQAILRDPAAFRRVIEQPEFVALYGEIKGEKNKILSPEFKAAAQNEPYLFNKQFYFMAELDPELVLGAEGLDRVTRYFETALPVNVYLRQALGV